MTPQELWQATLGELETLLSKANFTTWFRNTSIANYNEEKVVINVPNIFTKEYLAKKYHQSILKALRSITQNNNLKEIEYKIDSTSQNKNAFFSNQHTPIDKPVIKPIETPITTNHSTKTIGSIIDRKGGELRDSVRQNQTKVINKLNSKV